MTFGQNPSHPSPSRPTPADIHRRLGELLAYQARQAAAQPAAAPDDPSDDVSDDEADSEGSDFFEEHEEPQQFHEAYPQQAAVPSRPVLPAPSALPPPTLAPAALYGMAGRVVTSLAPHTEADPAAVLLQFLAAFGNLIGPGPHCRVGPTRHGLNLFLVLVGESSKARKGTSWRQISSLFAEAAPLWSSCRVTTARPTPATLLKTLRDQQSAGDARLLLLSEEFASLLGVLGRENNQLSPLLRCAWDGGDLCGHDGHHAIQPMAAHVSLVGHITKAELSHHLRHIDSANGFANRCLWAAVRRSQSLPNGGALSPEQHAALAAELRQVLAWTHDAKEICFSRTEHAQQLWNDRYASLSQGREDAYGAATSRAEAQVLRLSAIYAALDATPVIDTCHLQAALSVWDYCSAGARLLFDNAPIDPIAHRISQALDVNPEGLSRVQIRALFHRHVSKERIDLALEQLMTLGLIGRESSTGNGRPASIWAKVKSQNVTAPGTYGA